LREDEILIQRAGVYRASSYHIVDRRNFRKMLVLRKNSGPLFTVSYAYLHFCESDSSILPVITSSSKVEI
jgi:hypothetical protein